MSADVAHGEVVVRVELTPEAVSEMLSENAELRAAIDAVAYYPNGKPAHIDWKGCNSPEEPGCHCILGKLRAATGKGET